MRLTLPWLKAHLATEASPETIVERLTALGLEVEALTDPAAALQGFVVAEVRACGRHPNAERLSLCEVDAGDGTLHQVVCGAPNVRQGLKGVFAPIGAVIPQSGEVLKRATIRGVESRGMLCSARELKLGDDHEGIIELDPAAVVGRPAAEALGIEGPVIELAVTPDRADCLGVRGIARDLAAAGLGVLKPLDTTPVLGTGAPGPGISLDFPEGQRAACPLFVARLIRGVRNGPSPAWLQQRLQAIGLRPISTLVDITNYLTFDLGRPLHVFDAAKLRGDLRLYPAVGGETLAALDQRVYTLEPGMTVIADASGPVSIAGIIGGAATGVDAATRDVVLEVALFDPVRTALTGRRLGIESDARARFERGVDPALALPAVELATRLIVELCGGEPAPAVVAGEVPPGPAPIRFRTSQIARLAGITLERDEIERILTALGCGLDGGPELYDVRPPSWRADMTTEACVVEELARLHGYDRIPPVPVTRTEAVARVTMSPEQRRRVDVRRTLAARGLAEAVTWSFQPEPWAEAFAGVVPARLANPISAELSALRPSVLANLVAAAARNAARGVAAGGLFEIGPRFVGSGVGEQVTAVAGLRWGMSQPRHWAGGRRPVDAIDAKADALAALAAAGIKAEAVGTIAEPRPWYHPGRAGRLTLGPQTTLAWFGELHPRALAMFDLDGPVVGFEIDLDALPRPRARTSGKARPPLVVSPFPAVERDFAFVVDEEVEVEQIVKAVRQAERQLVREVGVFDIFRGAGIGEGRKSVAVAVRLQSAERTLEDAQVEQIAQKITAAVAKATGATLRA
jgi:phenylalanyl-tRNA synthetase beta chain